MALKAIIKTLDGLSEDVASLYVEKDGLFVLDLDGVEEHPSVANLSKTLKAERADRKSFEKKFKTLESQITGLDLDRLKEIDPDDYASKLELLEKYENDEKQRKTQKLKDEKAWEKLESQLKDQYQGEIESLQSNFETEKKSLLDQIATISQTSEEKVAQMQDALVKHLKGKKITAELAAAKASIPLMESHVSRFVDVQSDDKGNYDSVVVDAKGNQRFNNLGKPMTITELVAEFRENPDFTSAFEKEKKPGGSGSQGGRGDEYAGKNPFAKGEHFNLTEQAKLINEKPEIAQKLKEQATSGKD
jgi:hypothetical protein